MRVLKVGGNELSDSQFVDHLAANIKQIIGESEGPLIIVHGGGRAIAEMQAQLGLDTVKIDGLRVTDTESLAVAQMVLSGHSNKILVKALLARGIDAVGLSGVDGSLLRCVKKHYPTADLGLVGEVVQVRTDLLARLAGIGLTIVLSPISLGQDGLTYNVNADEAAGAVALAVAAEQLDFISNVPGVLREGELVKRLTAAETEDLIDKGIIVGGMIPKVRAALQAIEQGVRQTRIVDLAGLTRDGGTIFVSDSRSKGEHLK
ncbi:MAG: acetylglutamate kinase [Candidatus Promineifilaceae bacterium]|nr:acetylglutamate kinase [Candidatus Promineifilaceae bacterium]